MLKEREKHESVRIVSKNLKLEKEAVLQEKLKYNQRDSIALFGEHQEKAEPTVCRKYDSARDRDYIKLFHICFFSLSLVFTKVLKLDIL